jgi:thymidylate synthase (FAD)
MSKVELVWATPDGEALLGMMARVSNPKATKEDSASKLIKYLIKHRHWSPFEMVSVCMEIHTTRDIARQILRHRSFSFQEFSQRYAVADLGVSYKEARLQDTKNRQNSIDTEEAVLVSTWKLKQQRIIESSTEVYKWALANGIAKEQARAVLPEGLTMSKMYMSGTLRSWMHYVDIRCGVETQKEHRIIAEQCKAILTREFPNTFSEV